MTSMSAYSSRPDVQLHWRLCCRSRSASDWREAYECQLNDIFSGRRRWRGSSRQPGSWERAQTAPGGMVDHGGDLNLDSLPHRKPVHAAGGERARCGYIQGAAKTVYL